MHQLLTTTLASAFLLASLIGLAACDKSEPTVKVVQADAAPIEEKTAEDLARERIEARKNAPEPELDADGYVIGHESEPREQFELVWRLGETQIDSFHRERYDIIRRLQEIKLDDQETQAKYDDMVKRVQGFAIGRKREQLETAAGRLCETIAALRGPAEELMETGMAQLEVLDKEFKELEAREAEGKTVYQRQWDKLEDAKKQWSRPVTAGKFILLAVKSMLQEGFVLADHGPRRAQKELLKCLGEINERPLALPLAQTELEKILERARWYRKL